jgi:DNA-binding transcriptional LysR family regulator
MKETMSLRNLMIFRTVCREMSMSKAAEKLDLAQPAVSLAVRELEEYCGVRLFERIGRRIFLCEAGETLLKYADAVLNQLDEAEMVLRDKGESRKIRIGCNVFIAENWLAEILKAVKKKYGNADVQVIADNSEAVLKMLRENETDIGLVDQIGEADRFDVSLLREEEMAIVPAAGTKITSVRDLEHVPLMLREQGSGSRRAAEAVFYQYGLQVKPMLECRSDLLLKQLVRQGAGNTILPSSMIDEDMETVKLRGVHFRRYCYMVSLREKQHTAFAGDVMQIIRQVMKKE